MNKSTISLLAAVALMAGFTVACEDSSQPSLDEAFVSSEADLSDGTSTDTEATEPASQETAPAPTPEQAEAADALKNRRTQLHSSDRIEKTPLKGE